MHDNAVLLARLEIRETKGDEVQARMEAIKPLIEAQVGKLKIDGQSRAARNVASHNFQLQKPFADHFRAALNKAQRAGTTRKKTLSDRAHTVLGTTKLPASCMCSFLSEATDNFDKSFTQVGMLEFFDGGDDADKNTACEIDSLVGVMCEDIDNDDLLHVLISTQLCVDEIKDNLGSFHDSEQLKDLEELQVPQAIDIVRLASQGHEDVKTASAIC